MQSKYNINVIYWLLKRNTFTHQNNVLRRKIGTRRKKKIWHQHSLYTDIWFPRTKNSNSSYLRTSWSQLDHTATPSSLITTKLYQFTYRHATTQADWTKFFIGLNWYQTQIRRTANLRSINCEIICTTFQ